MDEPAPVTVVETADFLSATRKIMTGDERSDLIDFLAFHSVAGDLVPGSGGIRKLRWKLQGRGKRGSARIIYFFHSERLPLFALDAYAKNERSDLSQGEISRLRDIAKLIANVYAKKR